MLVSRAPNSIAAALVLSAMVACGHQSSAPGPDILPDGGSVSCAGTLSGVVNVSDAGFSCIIALLTTADGGATSFSMASTGALPSPVVGLGAVVKLPGPAPSGGALTPDSDGGVPDAGSFVTSAQLPGSATVQLADGEAFTLDSSLPQGSARLTFTYVSESGVPDGDARSHAAHGSFDATLPFLLGQRPDAGTDGGAFDAGAAVLLHATF